MTRQRAPQRPMGEWEDIDSYSQPTPEECELPYMYRVVDDDGEVWRVYDNKSSALRVCARRNRQFFRYPPNKVQRRLFGEWEEVFE